MATNRVSSVFSCGFAGAFGKYSIAFILALLFAQQAWAQTWAATCPNLDVSMATPSAATVDINVTNGCTVRGTATGVRLVIGNGVTATFDNLVLIGVLRPAVSLGTTATTSTTISNTATIRLKGKNVIYGGIGSAAIRVPMNAHLTITTVDGDPTASLSAFGGGFRPVFNMDAGAGIGGGNVITDTATDTGNYNDGCGQVTINGGTIYAYGGGGGMTNNATTTAVVYGSGAGIGGSSGGGGTNGGRGCHLTINGGNVTAVGGKPGANDIGPGIRYSAAAMTTETNRGQVGSTTINGGSVKAEIISTTTTNYVLNTIRTVSIRQEQIACPTTAGALCDTKSNAANVTGSGSPGNVCYQCTLAAGCTFTYTNMGAAVTATAFNQNQCRRFTTTVLNSDPDNIAQATAPSSSSGAIVNASQVNSISSSSISGSTIAGGASLGGTLGNCEVNATNANCVDISNAAITVNPLDPSSFCVRCTRGTTQNCNNQTITINYNGSALRNAANTANATVASGTGFTGGTCKVITLSGINASTQHSATIYDGYFTNNTNTGILNADGAYLNKYTFTVGTSSDTYDKSVSKCKFGANITCGTDVPPAAANKYGIKDVRTDGEGKVYFWLPSTYRGATGETNGINNNIYVNGVPSFADPNTNEERYHYLSTINTTTINRVGQYLAGNAVPEMVVPSTMANTKVGAVYPDPIGTITGPYRTDSLYGPAPANTPIKTPNGSSLFTTVGIEHVSAVGKPLAIIKGAFKRKSDYGEGTHTVQWYRAEANSTCINALRTYNRSTAGCAEVTSIAGSAGTLSSSVNETHYKPVAADYGKFIWAEVTVKDNRGSEAGWNTVIYPVVKIGVVINAVPKLNANFPDITGTDLKLQTMLTVGPGIPMSENLFLPYELLSFAIKTVTATAILEDPSNTERELSYKWYSDPSFIPTNEIGVGNPLIYTVPDGANAPSSDITLYAEIIDGSSQKLKKIEFCSGTFTGGTNFACVGTGFEADVNAQNIAVLKSIPKSGQVRLTFESEAVPVTDEDDDDVDLSSSVSLNGPLSGCQEQTNKAQLVCSYGGSSGLTAGTTYTLAVQGYSNLSGLAMSRFTTDAKVEKKADIVWITDALNYSDSRYRLIVGENARSRFAYDTKTDAGSITALYWYFEVSADRTIGTTNYTASDKPQEGDAEIGYDYDKMSNIIDKGCYGALPCSDLDDLNELDIDVAVIESLSEHFTKWVRLVVRVDGEKVVDGDAKGKPFFGPWVQVGVLLKPMLAESGGHIVPVAYTYEENGDGTLVRGCFGFGTGKNGAASTPATDQAQCRTFTAVNIGACDPTSPASISNNPNCTEKGLYVYDFNPYMLSAPARALWLSNDADKRMNYKLLDWTDDAATPNKCSISPTAIINCETFHQYTVPANPKGEYTIRPIMGEWTRPAIANATIYGGVKDTRAMILDEEDEEIANPNYNRGTTIVKVKDGGVNKEGENVSKFDNIIVVDFGASNSLSGEAQEIAVINTTTNTPVSGISACLFADNTSAGPGTACTITLPQLEFDNGYRVEIRGFESSANKETMDTEVFSFRTGLAPSFSAIKISNTTAWYTDVEPNKTIEKFAVGYAVTVKPEVDVAVGYKRNGGGDLSNWKICLKTNSNIVNESTDCISGIDTTSFKLAIANVPGSLNGTHYGKSVNIEISGTYNVNSTTGQTVRSVSTASVPVGVVVKVDPAGLCKNSTDAGCSGSGAPSAGALGDLSYRVENATAMPRIVYDATVPIRIVSTGTGSGTDIFKGVWEANDCESNANGSFSDNAAAITEWLPSEPNCDVTLKGSMTDGRIIAITPSLNSAGTATGFVFSFNPNNKPIKLGTSGTMVINDGNEDYTCDRNSLTNAIFTYESGVSSAAISFGCFDLPDLVGNTNYTLKIDGDFFVDNYGNGNAQNDELYKFTGAGLSYFASLGDKSSVMNSKTYGVGGVVGLSDVVTLTSTGTGPITVTDFCLIPYGLEWIAEATAISTCAKPANGVDGITVTASVPSIPVQGLHLTPAAKTVSFTVSSPAVVKGNNEPYRAVLIIKVHDANYNSTFKVPVVYTINKATITLTKIKENQDSKVYDGKETLPTTADLGFGWNPQPTGLTVTLDPPEPVFADENIGKKEITVTYTLGGTGHTNYAFGNGSDIESSVIKSEITKRDVYISFGPDPHLGGVSVELGPKPYDGSNELKLAPTKTPTLVGAIGSLDIGSRLSMTTTIYLDGANAGKRNVQEVRTHLAGSHANNYNLIPLQDLTLETPRHAEILFATIEPRSLAYLAKDVGTAPVVRNAVYDEDCVVIDTVEFGTKIKELMLRGRTEAVDGSNCPVVDNADGGTKQTVMGNWTVCTLADNVAGCAALYSASSATMPANAEADVGTVTAPKVLYAYYKVEAPGEDVANFANDLIVKVNLKVNALPILTIAANLSDPAVNQGVRLYNATDDVTTDLSKITPVADARYSSLLGCLKAASAKFVAGPGSPTITGSGSPGVACTAKDACGGKTIEVVWTGKTVSEAPTCVSVLENYNIATLPKSVSAGGIINRQPLEIKNVSVTEKPYDASTSASVSCVPNPCVVVPNTVGVETLTLSGNPTGTFVTSNVNLQYNSGTQSYGVGEVDLNLNAAGLILSVSNGGNAYNYELGLAGASSAVILQRTLDEFTPNNELGLKQRGVFGDVITDIRFSTRQGQGDALHWPASLQGVIPPGQTTRQSIPGFWEWEDTDYELGNVTTTGGFLCPSDGSNYYTAVNATNALFTPTSSNYKAGSIPVTLCIEPYRLAIGPPSFKTQYGVKVYDGNASYNVSDINAGNYRNINPKVSGKYPANFDVVPVSANYAHSEAAQGLAEYNEITIEYDLVNNNNNFLPPENSIYRSGKIDQRPVTIDGMLTYDKGYDGTAVADVDWLPPVSLSVAGIDGNPNSGPVGGIDLRVKSLLRLEFEFVSDNSDMPNPNAGENKRIIWKYTAGDAPHLVIGDTSSNVVATNYKLVQPNLRATIKRADLAQYMCEKKCSVDTPSRSKGECHDQCEEYGEGVLNQIMRTEMERLRNGRIEAQYGQTLDELAANIGDIMPTSLYDLFEGSVIGESPTGFGYWSWTNNNNELAADAYRTLYEIGQTTWRNASFAHSSGNYTAIHGIPIPIYVGKRQLVASIMANGREYDGGAKLLEEDCDYGAVGTVLSEPWIGSKLCPGKTRINDIVLTYNAVPKDTNSKTCGSNCADLDVIANVLDGNVGNDKKVNVAFTWKSWTNTAFANARYILPTIDSANNRINITQKKWPLLVPEPKLSHPQIFNETAFVYDTSEFNNLAAIKMNDGWTWRYPEQMPANPQAIAGPDNYISRQYQAVFTPPDALNYMAETRNIMLNIYRRNEDVRLASSPLISGQCGAEIAQVSIATNGVGATVWYQGQRYDEKTFTVTGLKYGAPYENIREYEIQAQAYGIGQLYSINFHRLLPLEKVAVDDRGAWSMKIDSSAQAELEYFRLNNVDIRKTQWFRGAANPTLVATGLFLPGRVNDISEYWVKLYNADGQFVISTCTGINGLMIGGYYPDPEVSPIIPQQKVNITASSFSSKVVAGGTTLTLNTPMGTTVSIYTMKGQLLSKMTAVDNRTVVRVPNTQGMYIVKLEAK